MTQPRITEERLADLETSIAPWKQAQRPEVQVIMLLIAEIKALKAERDALESQLKDAGRELELVRKEARDGSV